MQERKKYCLVQDNDCHWYLIPAQNKEEWDAFCEIDSDDEASWNVPEFARPVDGPHNVEFFLD